MAVKVTEADIKAGRLKAILSAIPEHRVREKLAAVQRNWRAAVYLPMPGPEEATKTQRALMDTMGTMRGGAGESSERPRPPSGYVHEDAFVYILRTLRERLDKGAGMPRQHSSRWHEWT